MTDFPLEAFIKMNKGIIYAFSGIPTSQKHLRS